MDTIDTDPDAVFGAVSDPRRRWLLKELPTDTPVDVEELARRCVESGVEGTGSGTATDRRRVYLAFLHVHIPKLEDSNLVEYDREDRTVRATESVPAAIDAAIEELERLGEQ